jgi:CBS domain containing-hemolysin-like protein
MTTSEWLVVGGVALAFVLSAVLALAETSFTKMSRIRALALEEEGRKNASKLAKLLETPERTINSVLLLLLVCQFTAATLVGVLVEAAGPAGVILGTVGEVVVFFVFSEVAPKTYAIQNTDKAALGLTPLLWWMTRFAPLRGLTSGLIGFANVVLPGRGIKQGPFVTEEDLRTMANVAADEEVIEREERRLIHSIFEFGDTVVREVMLPRPDMIAIEADATIEQGIEKAIEAGFSRLPAYDETTDNIIGLVYVKDLVRSARGGEGDKPVRSQLRDAVFVPEQKRVAELLREMQSQQFHMAIVVDEYGGTAGLVTLEDLLEEIVGEITDEYDVEGPGIERLPNGALRVPGQLPINDLNEELRVELPDDEWDTVGGLVFNLLGHVPVEGEAVKLQGLEFRTERVQGRRIASVQITRVAPAEPHEAKDEPVHDAASPS